MDLTRIQSDQKNREKRKKKKKTKSSPVIGVTGGVIAPKDKTRVLVPCPFAFLHCYNAQAE